MATITAGVRDALVGIYVGMFKAAPGLNDLNSMVADYESGMTQKQIAAELAMTADHISVYPTAMLNSEFADELVSYMLGDLAASSDKSWATNWIITKLNAGVSRSDVVVEASNALSAATNTAYDAAKAQHMNRVEVSKYFSLTQGLSSTSLSQKQGVILNVTDTAASVTAAKDGVDDAAADAAGQTYTLTAGIDAVNGGIGNDKINGQLGGTATLTALDDLDGGDGDDTLNIFDIAGGSALPGGLGLASIEQVNITSAGTVALNLSTYTDVTGISVVKSAGNVTLTAAGTQTVSATGVVGTTTITGGATQTVGTKGGFVLSGSKGAVTVTDTAQAAVASSVDGGTDISVTTTSAATGTVAIGATTVPTGTVTLVQNLAGTATFTGGAVGVKGGTSVDVTVNATNVNGATTTVGAIAVDGNGTATSVTVAQSAAATAAATVAGVAAVTQVSTITFTALAAGATATVGGLTFTAGAAGTTAAQTAAAFANLATGATHGASALGAYSGSYTATYGSGAVSTATVTFTQNAAGVAAALPVAGGAGAPATVTAGAAATTAAGKAGVVNGADTITDGGATDKIASVTLKEYSANATITSDALTSLSLTNSGTGTATVTNTKATTLALEANKVAAAVNIGGVYTTLNATATGADSTFTLTAGGVTALTVAGDKLLNISGGALGAVKTVSVTGSAGLSLNAGDAGTITGVDTSGTTGTVTTTIDGTKATYTGGAGKDVLTLSTVAPTKTISLAGGDDTLTLAAGTSSSTGAITGGDGSDTLVMAAADADAADATATFSTKVTGFEILSVTGAAGTTIDVGVLGSTFTGVTTNNAGSLTANNIASGATLTVTAVNAAAVNTVGIANAATGTADVLNVVLTAKGDVGDVTAASVETVNISSGGTAPLTANDVDLIATSATNVVVTGANALILDVTGNTKLTTIDASAATGALTVTAAASSATTITGGSAADVLTASSKGDILIGGAGNDTLTSGTGLGTLTGGTGNDSFVIVAPANVNSYSTITDAAAGDKIDFTDAAGVETFVSSAVTLAPTAVFQDYANAAINSLTAVGNIAWFQYGGDTYVVQQQGAFTALSDFENGTDVIVKLTGLKDLSTATLNTDTATLQLF